MGKVIRGRMKPMNLSTIGFDHVPWSAEKCWGSLKRTLSLKAEDEGGAQTWPRSHGKGHAAHASTF